MKRAMMFFFILAVVLLANLYVFFRLWQMMPAVTLCRILLVTFAVAAVSSFFLYFLVGGRAPAWVTTFMYKLGTSWFFILLYLAMIFLLLDIVRFTRLVPMDFMRGSWTGLLSVAGVVTLLLVWGYVRYNDKKRATLDIVAENKVPAGRAVKIVAASDLHLGYGIGAKELEKWVELINAENPDVVLFAGDVIDTSIKPLEEEGVAYIFRKIRSKHGVYAAPGNHEYISGIDRSVRFLEEAGMTVLRDSSVLVDSTFYLVGRDDRSNRHRETIPALLATLDRSKPIVMLDHQPYHLEEVEKNGVDLQISGHTHHGQVWPISLITNIMYEDSYGYLKKGDSHIYVSSGLGIWGGKFRIGTRSEYVVTTLTGQ